MLTRRQNLLETIKGGNPDRFVNQYEYLGLVFDPISMSAAGVCPRGGTIKNGWGVTISFPEGLPGPFPDSSGNLCVLKDITQWRETLKMPQIEFSDEEWADCVAMADSVDRNDQFVAPFIANGIFEKLHYLMGMEESLMAFYEEPDDMHDLIDFLADYEIAAAKEIIAHIHPNAIFHHDDWGSQISSFMSPEMFEEFILPAYQKIYGFWKENGVELIVHHSDSYAANLVPHMIECGIDIWQGVISTNDLPKLVKEYGGQISFHGGLNNGVFDVANLDHEALLDATRELCTECGKHYLIPGMTMGGPESSYAGVYEAATAAIDKVSKEMF
jgi:Uroporphyrinogen-III decarboxylase